VLPLPLKYNAQQSACPPQGVWGIAISQAIIRSGDASERTAYRLLPRKAQKLARSVAPLLPTKPSVLREPRIGEETRQERVLTYG